MTEDPGRLKRGQDQCAWGLVVAPWREDHWVGSFLGEGPSRLGNSMSKHTEDILAYLRKGKLSKLARAWGELKCWELRND